MRFALLLVACVLAAPRTTDACSWEAHTFPSPRAGTPLPAHPRILVHVDTHHEPVFAANATFTSTLVGRTVTSRLYELHFHIARGDLAIRLPGQQVVTFSVGATTSHRARIAGVNPKRDNSCNGAGFAFDVEGDAIGFRLDWHDGSAPDWFMRSGDQAHFEESRHGALRQLREFDLVALFADGTERWIGTSRMMNGHDYDRVRRPVELLGVSWPMLAAPYVWGAPVIVWQPSPFDVDDPQPRGVLAVGLLLALVAWQFRGRVRTSSGADYVRPCSWR
jgi:hypothetical protein